MSNQWYFLPHHYAAFEGDKPTRDGESEPARQERKQVREALLWLGDQLWPWVSSHNPPWDLHRHRQSEHYVSSYHFVFTPDGQPIVDNIGSMWLHYGKSPEQLDWLKTIGGFDYRKKDVDDYYNAFYLHTRIQIYISATVVRCWLLLATDKNYYDRSEYLKRLMKDKDYGDRLWELLQPLLGNEFFYEVNDSKFMLEKDTDRAALMSFIKKDRQGYYSGIVKEYIKSDPRIGLSNIIQEMKNNIELLYPIYDHMAWRPRGSVKNSKLDITSMFGGNARAKK